MYSINLEATVEAFIDIQKCELETDLEVLYLCKGLQKTAGDTPWLHFPIKKPHNSFFMKQFITDQCRDTSSDHCGKGKGFFFH